MNLEGGVIVKFDRAFTDLLPGGNYVWGRTDATIPITYRLTRQANASLNQWLLLIISAGCIIRFIHIQDEDETLWTGDEDVGFTALGVCAGDPPIGTLSLASYRTQKEALVDFPDLQIWDWDL